MLDAAELAVVGPVQAFLFPLLIDAPVAHPGPGEVDGRPTRVLTVDGLRVEIDREHGVVLAVQYDSGRVEARDTDFPAELPDPAWTGEAERWVFDDGRLPEEDGCVTVLLQRWINHRRIPARVDTLRDGEWSSVTLAAAY